jgi:hypothetical protein
MLALSLGALFLCVKPLKGQDQVGQVLWGGQGQAQKPEKNKETTHQPKHTLAFSSVRASASEKGRLRTWASLSRV